MYMCKLRGQESIDAHFSDTSVFLPKFTICFHSLLTWKSMDISSYIPYTTKHLRGKTFAVFADFSKL